MSYDDGFDNPYGNDMWADQESYTDEEGYNYDEDYMEYE